jgi:hypothetical protein
MLCRVVLRAGFLLPLVATAALAVDLISAYIDPQTYLSHILQRVKFVMKGAPQSPLLSVAEEKTLSSTKRGPAGSTPV